MGALKRKEEGRMGGNTAKGRKEWLIEDVN